LLNSISKHFENIYNIYILYVSVDEYMYV
jgi:hypothetical protein